MFPTTSYDVPNERIVSFQKAREHCPHSLFVGGFQPVPVTPIGRDLIVGHSKRSPQNVEVDVLGTWRQWRANPLPFLDIIVGRLAIAHYQRQGDFRSSP